MSLLVFSSNCNLKVFYIHVKPTFPCSQWRVRECDPLIVLLETWMPVLPTWVMENIQDQLILPRVLAEVEAWNPLTDTVPIHSWLHPWLPLMSMIKFLLHIF